jgi:hypothetical protein
LRTEASNRELIHRLLDDIRSELSAPITLVFDWILARLAVSRFGVPYEYLPSAIQSVAPGESATTVWSTLRGALNEYITESLSSTYVSRGEYSLWGRPGVLYRCASPLIRQVLRTRSFRNQQEEESAHASAARSRIGGSDSETWAEMAWHFWNAKLWPRLERILVSTPLISEAWLWDRELILQYGRDLRDAGIEVADLIVRRYKKTEKPVPGAIIEFLGAIAPAMELDERFTTPSGTLTRQHRPFSWGQIVMGEAELERVATDDRERGFYIDELEHAERVRNRFFIGQARSRLSRWESRMGENEAARDGFREAIKALSEVDFSDISLLEDGEELLRRELQYATAGLRDCLMLLGCGTDAEETERLRLLL